MWNSKKKLQLLPFLLTLRLLGGGGCGLLAELWARDELLDARGMVFKYRGVDFDYQLKGSS